MRSNQLSYTPVLDVLKYSKGREAIQVQMGSVGGLRHTLHSTPYQPKRHWRILRRLRVSAIFTLFSLLTSCISPRFNVTPTLMPTITPPDATGWEQLAPGLERRVYTPPDNSFGALLALRIDPTLYTFRAHYTPGNPMTLPQWQETLPSAVAFVNANYFDPQFNALGLVIADGVVYGQSFVNMGGLLQVQNGVVRVRSTILEPYAGEPLEQAVQAFPMLVTNGQTSFDNSQGDRASRRTVVAQDAQGRIILMATPLFGLSLVELASYLPTTDLGIINAVNLDGGGSTMMYTATGGQPYMLTSFDGVPTVLAVYPR